MLLPTGFLLQMNAYSYSVLRLTKTNKFIEYPTVSMPTTISHSNTSQTS